ncbi:PREDICTED: uncharacterized protein LOC107349234 [Acropora digitifera]|uniref:uncharacterized protein LOC107349234 n=1 Tax=Acropora digitifera TaxID=70779 RepID=UPI00077A83F2|nr:PREDICTED: uncharacterized protein LOC107349234 [Acropora digitifera]
MMRGLICLTHSLLAEFYFLNFFNAENHGKRPLQPLVTTSPERQGQNRDIPEKNPAAPHQAVAANNLGNQASSAIPERGQQHPFDAVVTSGNENGRQGARHGASGDQQDSLREYGETSTAPGQGVVAVNLGQQGPSSISEAAFHPDLTTMQRHIVGDVVGSGRENEIQRKRPSHPIVTTTVKRLRRNACIPEEMHDTLEKGRVYTTNRRPFKSLDDQKAIECHKNRLKIAMEIGDRGYNSGQSILELLESPH